MATARDRPPEEAAEDTSFARGLRVFLTIADRGEVRADELSVLLETPVSTIYRYLRTLTDFGFVDRHEGGFRLGPRLLISSGAIVTSEELIRHADPILAMLTEESGETALISRRLGLTAVSLGQRPSRHPLRVSIEPGTASPLDVGALAKVLLAYAPAEIQDEVLVADRDDTERLRAELDEIVREGIARTAGEEISGTVSIAVPVLQDDGIVAALGLIAPDERASLPWRRRAARLLVDAARAIEREIGSPAP